MNPRWAGVVPVTGLAELPAADARRRLQIAVHLDRVDPSASRSSLMSASRSFSTSLRKFMPETFVVVFCAAFCSAASFSAASFAARSAASFAACSAAACSAASRAACSAAACAAAACAAACSAAAFSAASRAACSRGGDLFGCGHRRRDGGDLRGSDEAASEEASDETSEEASEETAEEASEEEISEETASEETSAGAGFSDSAAARRNRTANEKRHEDGQFFHIQDSFGNGVPRTRKRGAVLLLS